MAHLLFLGGTQFVGRTFVEEALAAAHTATLFHRGHTGNTLFQGDSRVEHIHGDRKESIELLGSGTWDLAVDCCGYDPLTVRKSARYLKGRVGKYAFVSTISVYAPSTEEIKETSSTLKLPAGVDPGVYDREFYGALKALCEQEVLDIYGDRGLNLRIGLQVGAYDHTDRFGDWIERIGYRAQVAVPSDVPMTWQQIDARDTARYSLSAILAGRTGAINITGAVSTLQEVVARIRDWVNPSCELVSVGPDQILAAGVEPWQELTLWLPEAQRGSFPLAVNTDSMMSSGFKLTRLEDTVRDSWKWLRTLDPGRPRKAGLSSEMEQLLIARG